MKKSNWFGLVLSAVVVVLFLVWSSADAQRPYEAGPYVQVVNKAANPFPITAPAPIPVTGSLIVSNTAIPVTAAGTFPVTAADTLPVTGTVNIGGTAHVMVDNEGSNPVPVTVKADLESAGDLTPSKGSSPCVKISLDDPHPDSRPFCQQLFE